MKWSEPYFGKQHLMGVKLGHRVTIRSYADHASCEIAYNGRTMAFTKFDSLAEAQAWGEAHATKHKLIPSEK